MSAYDRAVASAVRMMAKYGRPVTIQKLDATPTDQDKPWKRSTGAAVLSSVQTSAVFVQVIGKDFGRNLVDEELLKRADEVCLVAPAAVDLQTFTAIVDDGVRWRIEWAQVLKPGDQIVLYLFGVRR